MGNIFETEIRDQNSSKTGNFSGPMSDDFRQASFKAKNRSKSSLRMKYEAESISIQKKLGDLEDIRNALGISQRKMCQLLLVDPSAWTRWTKSQNGNLKGDNGTTQVPPHIYRMLQWYLAIQDKYPALDVHFWLQTVAQKSPSATKDGNTTDSKNSVESEALKKLNVDVSALKKQLQRQAGWLRVLSLCLGVAIFLLLYPRLKGWH